MIEANIFRENGQIYQVRLVYELDDRQDEHVTNVSSLEDVELEALKLANDIDDYEAYYYNGDELEELDLEAAYTRCVDKVFDEYGPRMKGYLEAVAEKFDEDHPVFNASDEEYQWMIFPSSASIAFSVAESLPGSGTLEGVNFAVQIVGDQGEILGGKTPFNYSKECWVPAWNDQAVRDRFSLFDAEGDADEIVGIVEEHQHGE